MNRNYVFILLVFLQIKSWAQDTQDVKLDIFVSTNLSRAINKISDKYKVDIVYDTAAFEKETILAESIRKPLSKYLEDICKTTKKKYYQAEDGTFYIVERWYTPADSKPTTATKYAGEPTRFNFSISGKVVDKETREVLPFVSIKAIGGNNGTMTNVDGFFSLMKVPYDTATLLFSYIGYQQKPVYLSPTFETSNIIIELSPDVIGLEEVVVSAEKQDVMQVSGIQSGMIKMSPKKLSTLPNLGEKDILRSFQLMPGISAANENSSGLYVRGGTPDQVLIRYDGFTVYNVEHMFGFFSAFNSNAIKDVQLYKGGFDAKYGGRLSSVVEITGKEGNQKQFNSVIDLSLMSVNGFVEFPLGEKASVVLAGRRSWKSPIYNKIFDQFVVENEAPVMAIGRGGGASEQQETSSYFYDLNGKITFKPTHKDVLALSIYNGKDDLDNSIIPQSRTLRNGQTLDMNIETTDLTQWGNTGASFKWSRQINDRLYLNSLVSYSNYYSLRDRNTSGTINRGGSSNSLSKGINEENNLIDISGNIDFEYKLTESNQIEFGVQATHNAIDYSYTQDDTVTIIERVSRGEIYTGFLQDKINLFNNKLNITPGLRYSYFSGTQKSYFEPRLNAMFQITDRIKLKGSSGNYYQFAKRVIREDITEGSRDFWVLSDDNNLPVSSSLQHVVGISYETPKYLFDVEGFYKDLNNVTEYSLRIEADPRNVNYSENFFTGTGLAKGIDFLVQKKSGKLTGWLGYTLSQVSNNILEFGNYDFYASHDVTHEFKTVATYKWRQWDFGANWIYASGKPYTTPEGGYQLTLLDGSVADYINVSVKNGNRLPAYHRLDLSATYNFTLGKSSPASIGFSLFNVYNKANVWYNEYEIIDNEVIETPVYFLGITPNITLSIRLK